jgi:OmpA-OmpF porin, OOP family
MKRMFELTLAAGLLALPLVSGAVPGYVVDSSGTIVRNSAGECWHTSEWTPSMAVVGCDGKVAEAPMAPEPVMKQAPEPRMEHMTLGAETLFGFNKAKLTPEGQAKLDELAGHMKSFQSIDHVTVTGYTDRIGSKAYNLKLSQRRADAVKDYLAGTGAVDAGRIEAVGKGKAEPVSNCHGVRGRKRLIACLAPDRRVVVDVAGMGTR